MCMEIMPYDKENGQIDYQYMARSIERNELEIGYIVIEKPWYSPEEMWKYYIVKNEYGGGGFCGGATDLGLKKILVDRDTVEVYNQIARIKYNKEKGISTKLITGGILNGQEVAFIDIDDEIPYELWS
ncbi:hypothetical protein [Clostridium cuniculi]|uniref:hypothetical protein n=1 Tax=Clostridium cuniculi TaxID=2548455 RepID=UPI0010568F23|nr:hypothetical protein [Clostridium cuniculi]